MSLQSKPSGAYFFVVCFILTGRCRLIYTNVRGVKNLPDNNDESFGEPYESSAI